MLPECLLRAAYSDTSALHGHVFSEKDSSPFYAAKIKIPSCSVCKLPCALFTLCFSSIQTLLPTPAGCCQPNLLLFF